MQEDNIKTYVKKIYEICSRDTCYDKVVDKWTENNRFWGHCAVVALLINDKFGGEIKKCNIEQEDISHYFNEIDGIDYDYTISQYSDKPIIKDIKTANREKMLSTKSTEERYSALKKLLK